MPALLAFLRSILRSTNNDEMNNNEKKQAQNTDGITEAQNRQQSNPAQDQQPIRMLVGLGNPGREYENTRHNIGWTVLDAFAAKHGLKFDKRQARSIVAQGQVYGRSLVLCKPLTYMNNSGEAVGALARFYKIAPTEVLIVYDDMDLPLGKLRLREGGSAGGHNGMRSIIQHLSTTAFPRLRVGIGRPEHQAINHVLSRFAKDELPVVAAAVDRAVDALDVALTEGITPAMNQFNP